MAFILFLGGIRSGKTKMAEIWGEAASPSRLFISTSINSAQKKFARFSNPAAWHYLEDPLEPVNRLNSFLEKNPDFNGSVVIGSVGTWIGNLMAQNLSGNDILRRIAGASRTLSNLVMPCGIISTEAGLAPPPASGVSRKFTELLGVANQILARDSHCAIMVIAGLPLLIKGSMPAILDRVTRADI